MYRVQFNQFIDRVSVELDERFSTGSKTADLRSYRDLSSVFKTGVLSAALKKYPELDFQALKRQVATFREHTHATSLHAAKLAYVEMSSQERSLYRQVFKLIRILLVCPVSAATCERSFSVLRCLKTYLRNCLAQGRLNHNAVARVHRDVLQSLNVNEILNEFCSRSDQRKQLFGIKKFE